MESRYQNGLIKACQWLSVASHQLFELSIEIALCDDKRGNISPIRVDESQLDSIALKQNPYATELNELAGKLRDKLDIIMVINDLDPFEIESWHLLDIFDDDTLEKKRKWAYHDLVRFCYKQITFFPAQLLAIISPDIQLLQASAGNKLMNKEDALYEKSSSILLDALDDFNAATQGFIIARYLAKNEGRIV